MKFKSYLLSLIFLSSTLTTIASDGFSRKIDPDVDWMSDTELKEGADSIARSLDCKDAASLFEKGTTSMIVGLLSGKLCIREDGSFSLPCHWRVESFVKSMAMNERSLKPSRGEVLDHLLEITKNQRSYCPGDPRRWEESAISKFCMKPGKYVDTTCIARIKEFSKGPIASILERIRSIHR